MSIRSFIVFLFLIAMSFEAGALDDIFCLNKSKTRTAKVQSSFDFDLKQATDRAGWTWINSGWDGDRWPLDIIQSPDGSSKTSVPELYYKTCSYWQDIWGGCRYASSSFSQAAGVAFITGNQKNILGSESPKSYALYGDTVVELPSNSEKAAQYRGDINAFGYAALRGLKEELILFNGDQSVTIRIPESHPREDALPVWSISNDINTGRSFVHTNALKDRPAFLYEINSEPGIRNIGLDPNIKGWLILLSEPETKQMFLIDRYGIYAEIGNAFKRVAHLPETDYIYGPADLGYTEDNTVYFAVVDGNKTQTPYILQSKSDSNNCDVVLSLKNDIEIKSK